jgi:hypothetical protein
MFRDVFEDKAFVPLRHVGNIPHRVMAFEIATGEARWSAACHPLLKFFKHTSHPDIDTARKLPAQAVRTPMSVRLMETARARVRGFGGR